MKKNLLKVAFVAIFGLICYSAYNSEKGNNNISSLMLDNVEALASEASILDCYYWGCQWDFSRNCHAFVGIAYAGTCYNRRG